MTSNFNSKFEVSRKIEEYITSCEEDEDICEEMELSSNEGKNFPISMIFLIIFGNPPALLLFAERIPT